MSNYMLRAKHRVTGKSCEVSCIDGYFGKRQYGYSINEQDGKLLTEEEFYNNYEVLPNN